MAVVRLTPAADNDLAQIVDHIGADNLPAAFDWLTTANSLFQLLATQPEMGARCQTRSFLQSRRQVYGNYNVYYRPTAEGIEILRVIHGAREQERLL
jgi:toxin ParE1/3/4